jgi:hypothetical protein
MVMLSFDLRDVQVDVSTHHVERAVSEDSLQAEQVPAIQEIELGERVPECVGIAATGNPCANAKPLECVVDGGSRHRATVPAQ